MTLQLQHGLQIIEREFPEFSIGPHRQAMSPAVHSGLAPIEDLASGVVRMPGGHNSDAHIHAESAITVYVRTGMVATLVGEDMIPVVQGPGSVIYIGPGIPHCAVNLHRDGEGGGAQEAAVAEAFEARTDPTFTTDVTRLPDLDALVAQRVEEVRRGFERGQFAVRLATPSVRVVTRTPAWR
ncbi:MAG TPA: hypothetical protein VGL46_09555 [Pseudonocardiaceae bacterium]|jgi:uncharacterized RmlC-like cupin family protein